jgi:hypothetical protein
MRGVLDASVLPGTPFERFNQTDCAGLVDHVPLMAWWHQPSTLE